MINYHVGTSPITNTIYAGRLDKTGQCWTSKSDVTGAACGAVPFSWPPGRVPGHSEQLVANLTHLPSWRIRHVKGPRCVACNDTRHVPGDEGNYCRMCP